MKTRTILALGLIAFLAATPITQVQAQLIYTTTTFSFQGRIYESGLAANNLYDFEFRLFDAQSNGVQAGPLVSIPTVPVTNGFFSAPLDFGANVITGSPRWLEIHQRVSGNGPFVPLADRVPLLSTPHAIYAYSAGNAAMATSVSPSAVTAAALASGAVGPAAIANGSVVRSVNGLTDALNIVAGPGITLGTLGNTLSITGSCPCPSAWLLGGNGGTTAGPNFLGTTDDQPLELKVHGKRTLKLIPNDNSPNIVGGYSGNSVFPGLQGAIIAGGGTLFHPDLGGPLPNEIGSLGDFGFIGGGIGNYIGGSRNAIVGGQGNRIVESANSSVIAGGGGNLITAPVDGGAIGGGGGNSLTNFADWAVIAGGITNTATNRAAFIGAGMINLAGGEYSATAGGTNNRALGESSSVAGGADNSATARQSSIGGGRSNVVNSIAGAIAGGTANTVNGPNSMVGGGNGNRVDASASVIAGGQFNYVGFTNALAAILGGNANTNVGLAATISGGERNLSLGAWSAIPGGKQAVARSHGELAFASGQLNTLGDAQVSTFVLRRRFNGSAEMFLDGDAGSQRIAVPNGAVWTLRFQISAVSVTGTNFASYEVSGMMANVGGAMLLRLMDGSGAIVGTTRPIFETPGAVPWLATPNITGDGTLRINVFAGEEVKWCARIDATEVTR